MSEEKILSSEDWLNKNCENNDWDWQGDESVGDSCYTSNVIQYMKKYAEYYYEMKVKQ